MGIGGNMVAAHEFHIFVGNLHMGVGGRDLVIVINFQPMLFPGPRFRDYM
jgi:hypothetical protein